MYDAVDESIREIEEAELDKMRDWGYARIEVVFIMFIVTFLLAVLYGLVNRN